MKKPPTVEFRCSKCRYTVRNESKYGPERMICYVCSTVMQWKTYEYP